MTSPVMRDLDRVVAVEGVTMTKAQARKEAERRFGPTWMMSDDGTPSSPALRDAARRDLRTLRAMPRDQRPADWRRRENALMGAATRYRYCVGRRAVGFLVEGMGDSWADAFADHDKREAADRKRFAEAAL